MAEMDFKKPTLILFGGLGIFQACWTFQEWQKTSEKMQDILEFMADICRFARFGKRSGVTLLCVFILGTTNYDFIT